MADKDTEHLERTALGVRHAFWMCTAPGAVFRRIEDTGAYGWALFALLTLVTLIGYAEVQTGLIDRVVDERTERQLDELERNQAQLVDRVELSESMESIRKAGEFDKLITRISAVAAAPAYVLASILLIASGLYAAVALTGRKPEYHTLVAICVYAGFIELVGYTLRLAMMLAYRTTEVDTSLAMFAPSKAGVWLAAIDPFRIWFWVLAAMGLVITQQLSRRMAVVSCSLFCLIAIGARVAFSYMKA